MNYLKYIYEEIHTVSLATVNEYGQPISVIVDITDYDDQGLFFITAKGKSLYKRLVTSPKVSISAAFGGSGTLEKKALTLTGEVISIGKEKLNEILNKNLYLLDIYPNSLSRESLVVFKIINGQGELFDLSVKPPYREEFSFGLGVSIKTGYFITKNCVKCGACIKTCPTSCITEGENYNIINQNNCLRCGACYNICSFDAIVNL